MKEIHIYPLTPASAEFINWYGKLYSGIKGGNNKRLYALNEKYCLFKIVFPAYAPAYSAREPGTTEYIVAEINSKLSGYGIPEPIYKVEGRMTNAHIEHIEKTFKLTIIK